MSQLKLVQKPIVEKPNTGSMKVIKRIVSSKGFYERVNNWIELCKANKENYAYIAIEYHAEVFLNGAKKECLSLTNTMERPFRANKDDSYAGSWGCGGNYDKNNLDELKKELIEWRKNFLEVPYCKEKADGTALRDIKAENVRIFIDDKAKEFISRTAKWTLNELAQELKAIKENPLTQQYLKKFERMNYLEEEIDKIEYDILPELRDKAEKAFDNNTETQTILDGEKFDLNAAYDLFKRLKAKAAQMEKEYNKLRHEMYRWD